MRFSGRIPQLRWQMAANDQTGVNMRIKTPEITRRIVIAVCEVTDLLMVILGEKIRKQRFPTSMLSTKKSNSPVINPQPLSSSAEVAAATGVDLSRRAVERPRESVCRYAASGNSHQDCLNNAGAFHGFFISLLLGFVPLSLNLHGHPVCSPQCLELIGLLFIPISKRLGSSLKLICPLDCPGKGNSSTVWSKSGSSAQSGNDSEGFFV